MRVRFVGLVDEPSIRWGNHADPRGLLQEGCLYEVERKEVHSWHTKIFLKGFPGKQFNSVWFEEQQGGGEEG